MESILLAQIGLACTIIFPIIIMALDIKRLHKRLDNNFKHIFELNKEIKEIKNKLESLTSKMNNNIS